MPAIHFFRNVNDVYQSLYRTCKIVYEANGRIEIKNIGLDWETTWPHFRYDVFDRLRFRNLSFLGLVVDPESDRVRADCTEMISLEVVRASIDRLIAYRRNYANRLAGAGITIDARKYPEIPLVHGFCVSYRFFFSFTRPRDEGLSGGDGLYHFCERDPGNFVVDTYFDLFAAWFRRFWNEATLLSE